MGGLFVLDSIFYQTGLYDYSAFCRLAVQTFCRLGITALVAWAVTCNRKVKSQLIEKYPQGIGRLLIRWT